MKFPKKTGSYYTPAYLSEFILRYVAKHFDRNKRICIFEPSVGDGSFVKAFNLTNFPRNVQRFSFTAIDKIKGELNKAEKASLETKKLNSTYSFIRKDFLGYQKNINRRFDLIVGNPPYIKKQLLNKTQISSCENIHAIAKLGKNSIKNIWPSFLIRCCELLKKDGVLAFVLPAELLQVKFSQELRSYLVKTFARTEIFTFDELLFDCKGQDTILLIGYKDHDNPGQFYSRISDVKQLLTNNFTLTSNHALVDTETKWTHHQVSAEDIIFIKGLAERLQSVNNYCDSKPGIVTAANNFFIINEDIERQYHLHRFAYPIIQKGIFVNGSIEFDLDDYNLLASQGKRSKVLAFKESDIPNFTAEVLEYLKIGEELNLPSRYKCALRDHWYIIPNVSTIPQGFFFKRCHLYPKLLKNSADVLVTDSAYKIEMKNGYDIGSLIFSFYNSLTLAFCELEGRYYGGGVLELTPSEFKKIPIPYAEISVHQFNNYTRQFEDKERITDVLRANDFAILNRVLGLTSDEVARVHSIYDVLVSKRLRNTASKQD